MLFCLLYIAMVAIFFIVYEVILYRYFTTNINHFFVMLYSIIFPITIAVLLMNFYKDHKRRRALLRRTKAKLNGSVDIHGNLYGEGNDK